MVEGGIEDLLASAGDDAATSISRTPRALVVIGVVVLLYGVGAGIVAGTVLDIAPYSGDPDGFKVVGVSLLWPLGDLAYWIGALVGTAVATVAGDGIGLLVGWFVFVIEGIAIALAQAVVVGAVIAGLIRLAVKLRARAD